MKIQRGLLSVLAGCLALGICASAAADAPAADPVIEPVAVAPASVAPAANKIWQCTTKGVRTFSSNPCGTNPTVRELNPVNVMEPPPMYHVTHTYAPAPNAQSAESPSLNQAAGDSTDNAYNAYPGYIVVTRSHRTRSNASRNHPHPHR